MSGVYDLERRDFFFFFLRVCSSSGVGVGFRVLGSGPEGGRTSWSSSSLAGSANDACHCGKWSMVMKCCCCCCCCFTKKPLRESALPACLPSVWCLSAPRKPLGGIKLFCNRGHSHIIQILQIFPGHSPCSASSPKLTDLKSSSPLIKVTRPCSLM